MVLAFDIGNTHMFLGGFSGKKILFTELISTNRSSTALEYMSLLQTTLKVHGLEKEPIDGAIISSVVPTVTATVTATIERFFGITPIVVGPGVKSGLKIRIDNPAQLGSDLVVCAVAGIKEYPVPQINIYMGTATTISLIDSSKTFLGTTISAGMGVASEALSDRTSQLPCVALETPKKVVGTNTVDSMRSGVVFYTASAIDGMIERIEEEYGEPCTVVVTGRYAPRILPHCKHKLIHDPDLILKGLMEVYAKNT
ncbi:MAG: type III pantothenate kinase [Clostridiales bacterium]|nr:type III pantothenate kinase [Clostridiales bacterium]